MIPYGKQNISNKDIEKVIEVLKSDFITQGPIVHQFEEKVANYCRAKNAIAFNSATSALHAACLALGVTDSDIVWTSPISFVASSNCAIYTGASVDFIDIDKSTYNISISSLKSKLEVAKKENKLPAVVIPVHLSGLSCDMKSLFALSIEYGFKIIEDASHAIGAKYENDPVGSCKYSDICVFSFHPVKIITTGEGGMALTKSKKIAKKLRLFCSHGITKDNAEMKYGVDGPWYYEQIELGFNYRVTDIQAALGLSQMERLDEFVYKRHEVAEFYNNELKGCGLKLPCEGKNPYSSFHLYIIRVEKSKHLTVFNEMRSKDIGVNLHYIPIYHHPYYQSKGFKRDHCPEAERYYQEAISIPMYPDLTHGDQRFVCSTIIDALKK